MPDLVNISAEASGLIWSDWRSQIEHRISTLDELRKWIDVTPEEESAILRCKGRLRWSITPYYASLMDRRDRRCPVRLQAVPNPAEFHPADEDSVDPVGDRTFRKSNRVVHKYPDRVMILVTKSCPVYCRHCTRKYHTTDITGTYFGDGESTPWDRDFEYIAEHTEIRDVLLSGGDPLMYSDQKLEYILENLRRIPHVEIIRIGTRFPVLLPQRITIDFCRMLDRFHPIWLNTQFNHYKEVTEEAAVACDRLLRHGVVVQNQSVLLKDVNDDLPTMRALLNRLLAIRVRPYYLYQCDRVRGVSHFATTISEGRALMAGLLGRVTGFGLPQYIVTTVAGKIPLSEDYLREDDDRFVATGYNGDTVTLPK